jgi:hypothetical protein
LGRKEIQFLFATLCLAQLHNNGLYFFSFSLSPFQTQEMALEAINLLEDYLTVCRDNQGVIVPYLKSSLEKAIEEGYVWIEFEK